MGQFEFRFVLSIKIYLNFEMSAKTENGGFWIHPLHLGKQTGYRKLLCLTQVKEIFILYLINAIFFVFDTTLGHCAV